MIRNNAKRTRKYVVYALLAALILGGAFSSYANLMQSAYTVKTVHVFPAAVVSEGFLNAKTVTFQNVDEYGLLQDFNTINSATLDPDYEPAVDGNAGPNDVLDQAGQPPQESGEGTESITNQGSSELVDLPENGTTTASGQTESAVSTSTSTSDVASAVETNDASAAAADTEPTNSDTVADAVPSDNAQTGSNDALTPATPIEEESIDNSTDSIEINATTDTAPDAGTSTISVFLPSLGRLLLDATTTAVSTDAEAMIVPDAVEIDVADAPQATQSADTAALDSPELVDIAAATDATSTVTGAVTEPVAPDAVEAGNPNAIASATTSTSLPNVPAQPATAAGTTTADDAGTTATTSAARSGNVDNTDTESEAAGSITDFSADVNDETTLTCDDCGQYTMRLSNFGYPLDEGSTLSGAQLRLSLAALRNNAQDEVPSLTVNYSLDQGASWSTGGSVIIDDEVSNSVNGGYYLYALPDITDPAMLRDVVVELRFDHDDATVRELFVESAWLELFVLTPPENTEPTPFDQLIENTGFIDSNLSGDTLTLPDGEQVQFTFTDNNDDETLIIKSDQKTYEGLSQVTTYFSVTNTSDNADEFSVQTYFPNNVGEVTNLEVFSLNKPRQAVIPEYRPYVYHCEAGWAVDEPVDSLNSLTTERATSSQLSPTTTTELALSMTTAAANTAVGTITTTVNETDTETTYSCPGTNLARTCEVIEGEGTACIVTQKVQDHTVTQYARGWDPVTTNAGMGTEQGVLARTAAFFGLRPARKDVPDNFEGRVYTPDQFSIAPGETRYFKMDISFPPFSTGEYWVEAIGNREYGLLDPFWSSDWQYRMPLQVDNPTGTDQTEFQVRLTLDSAINDFWTNVDADGDDLRFVQETMAGNFSNEATAINNWLDFDFTHRIPLEIPAGAADADLANFPISVSLADFGSDFWNNVRSDGGDIRVYTSAGTELAIDLASIDTVAETGELHFLAPIIPTSAATTFYVYFGNSTLMPYAATDPLGAQAVWIEYDAVYHFNDTDVSQGAFLADATGNGNDLVIQNADMATSSGFFGTALDLRGANARAASTTWLFNGGDSLTTSGSYFMSSFDNGAIWQWGNGDQPNDIEFRPWYNAANGLHYFGTDNNTAQSRVIPRDTSIWRGFGTIGTSTLGGTNYWYENGFLQDTAVQVTANPSNTNSNGFNVGREGGGRYWDGQLDELRIRIAPRSVAFVRAESANLSSASDFYVTSGVQTPDNAATRNWYSTSWESRQRFTASDSRVSGTQTDFPVYLDLSILGNDFFNGVANDGSDIRITTGDGVTELPIELVNINTTDNTGELYFKADLGRGDNNEFYIYYDNEDAIAYERNATFGSENVWTNNFRAVYHFEEFAAGINNPDVYLDSTSNRYHADDNNTDTDTSGLFGRGAVFGAGVNDAIEPPNDIIDGIGNHTVSWWHNTTQSIDLSILSGANFDNNNEFSMFFSDPNVFRAYYNTGNELFNLDDTVGTFNTGEWQHYVVTGNTATDEVNLYVDGQGDNENPDTQSMTDTFDIPNGGLVIGQEQDAVNGAYDDQQRLIGQLDELRIAEVVRSAGWAETEYENMADNARFFSTSTAETLAITEFTELDFWIESWDSTADEAVVWVQVANIEAAGSLIYAYYGNSGAESASNELDTFSYDALTESYYVVDNNGAGTVSVVSLVDNNQVQLDGGTAVSLNRGEQATFTTYDGTSALSTFGPVSAAVITDSGDSSDVLVPISFATTSYVLPTARNENRTYVYAPFGTATVDFFLGDSATADDTIVLSSGAVAVSNTNPQGTDSAVQDGEGMRIESNVPILATHRSTNPGDGLTLLEPTTDDLYGVDSDNIVGIGLADAANPTYYCSDGNTGTYSGLTEGDIEVNGETCTNGSEGAGSAVRITGASSGVSFAQQADSDGNEATMFWPTSEFSTQYALTGATAYIAVVCAPEYGAVSLEVTTALGVTIETGTCSPGANTPGKAYFTNGTGSGDGANFAAGTLVRATNDRPFYMIMEDVSIDQDEKNVLGPRQARKFGAGAANFRALAQQEANGPEYTQLSFGWYQNTAALNLTTTWAINSTEFVSEGDSITGAGAVNTGDVLRLRMNVAGGNATSTAGTEAFALQYAPATVGQCGLATDWKLVGGVGSTTAAFAGFNNPSVSDGNTLPGTLLASSTDAGTYEERNLSNFNPVEFSPSTVMEWDWVLLTNNIDVNQTYCFRMIRANGETFDSYDSYPELETVGPPNVPLLQSFFDNEHTTQITPSLSFVANDIAGDDIHYELEIDDNRTFSSVVLSANSLTSPLSFTNLSATADKAPFSSGATVRFDSSSILASSTTYWWRVRASDPNGSGAFSDWSAPFSFTTDTTLTTSEWLQTTGGQFATNALTGVATTTGGADLVSSPGVITSTAIDFDDATIGNAWGELAWDATVTTGSFSVQIEYNNNGTWQLVPDASLTGNATGFTTSPVNLIDLDTREYNEIRLVANLSGSSVTLNNWQVRWGQRVEVPIQGDPFDNQKTADTLPTFDFVSTDPQGDDLEYEISFSTDFDFAGATTTYNSGVSTQFVNESNGSDLSPFISSERVTFDTPSGTPFANGVTYWWRTRAKDPAGGNAWSPWSEPDSFTIDTATTESTWFQTTQDQFSQGFFNGTVATTSGAVSLTNEIGEYGTVTLINNAWETITTSRTYDNMVVVASPEYNVTGQGDGRTPRIRNKTATGFEIKVDDHDGFSGTTVVDYLVLEAGEWELDDGAGGITLLAGTESLASTDLIRQPYDNGTGLTVPISTSFGTNPLAFATIVTVNDSTWVSAHLDAGNRSNEWTGGSIRLSLAKSMSDLPHSSGEDVDFVLMDQGSGTNNGTRFDTGRAFNDVEDSFSNGGHNFNLSGFTTMPGFTLLQQNSEGGGDGSFALKDLSGTQSNTNIFASVIEVGSRADAHGGDETVSLLAFESDTGILRRQDSGGLSGTFAGEDIIFSDGAGPKFANFAWNASTPASSVVRIQLQYRVSEGVYALVPDSQIPGNATGFTTSPIDLSGVDINTYDTIRALATLECVGSSCPTLDDWQLEWSEGVNMSGSLQEYDRTTNVTTGTVRAAVNGVPVSGVGVVSNGTWTLPNVTAFNGQIVTVWVDGADEQDEAVTSFVYDGLGDITGVALYEQHVSFVADEQGTITNQLLGLYDNTDDEDILFAVDGLNNLAVCGSGTCTDANLYVGPGQRYVPATSTAVSVSTHDFINDGTIELDNNSFTLSGSYDNNATSSTDTSTITFTAASTAETITSTEIPLDFHTLNISTGATATITVDVALDLSGDLSVNSGVFDRGESDIAVAGSVLTGATGNWQGTGTTTFNGTGSHTWTDNSPSTQNIGNVTIDGANLTVTAVTDVAAYDVVIGNNDTLVGGTGNTISVGGDWINNGSFNAGTSIVEIVEDDRVYPPIIPGSSDWYSDEDFGRRVPVVIDADEIDSTLTNFPIYLDLSTLGAAFWTDVASDGRDIRITSGDGQTELPHDLVEFDGADDTGELHFLADSVSATTDTSFYVYFANAAATAYAPTAQFGSQAVWAQYEAVYHFNDDVSATGNVVADATSNARDLVVTDNALATTSGQLGVGLNLESLNGYLNNPDFDWTAGDALVTSGWYLMDNADGGAYYQFGTGGNPNTINLRPWSGGGTGGGDGDFDFGDADGFNINPRNTTSWNQFFFVGTTVSGSSNRYYQNAILRDVANQTVNSPSNNDGFEVGRLGGGTTYFDALIDELRIATTTRNTAWIEAEYTNQNTPSIFYSAGVAESFQPDVVVDEATHNIAGGGSAFYTLRLNDASTTPVFTEPSLVVADDFIVATGTVALPTGTLTVGGSFTNNASFMHNNGTVLFNGAGTETITLGGTPFTNILNDVTFAGSGAWSVTDANATTSGQFAIQNGAVTMPTGTLAIGDTMNVTGGSFAHNDGSVRFYSDESINIITGGSAFNDVTFGAGGSFDWFDAAWTRRQQLTISASNLNATLTSFPVYVDLSDLGADFWSNVASDGADVRVTNSDNVQMPVELVSIDTDAETGELHFRADTLLATTDTVFYLYHNNGAASAPAPSSMYGRNNVWSNGYEAVFHLEETGDGTAGEFIDSTGNGYDGQGGAGAAVDVPTRTNGLLGSAQDFENSDNGDFIDLNTAMITGLEGANTKSVSAWSNVESWSDAGGLWNLGGSQTLQDYTVRVNDTNQWRAQHWDGDNTFAARPFGEWQHVALDYDGSDVRTYVNTINEDTIGRSLNTQDVSGYGVLIGRWRTGNYFDGLLDEVRFSSVSRSADWYAAEYANQNSPSTFYTADSQSLSADSQVFRLNEVNTNALGDVTINGVQLVAPTNNFNIGGSALNTGGSYNANNATTTFNSTDTGEVVAFGAAPFYNLVFDGVGGGWTVATNTVENRAVLQTGASFTQQPNTTLTVAGVFENRFAAAATTWTDSTLVLTGGDYVVTDRLDSGDDYANVSVSEDSDVVIWNSTIATSTIADSSSIYMPDYGGTDGLLRIYGQYDRTSGTEHWSYATDFDGTDLTGGSERAAQVRVANGGVVRIASTSALSALGSATASSTVDALAGNYSTVLSGSTIDARYLEVTNTDVAGVQLRDGATLGTFTDIEFAIATGTALTIDAATIEADPSRELNHIAFSTVTGAPHNVTLDDIPAAFWIFKTGTGNRYGESFDNDDGDPGAIQWSDSSFNIAVSGTIFQADTVTPMSAPVCNGVTEVVTVVVDGITTYRAPCSPLDGSYTVTGISYTGEPKLATYLESTAPNNSFVQAEIMSEVTGIGVSQPDFTVTRPEAIDGSVLVAIISKDDDPAITPPAGWTQIAGAGTGADDDIYTGVWYRVVSDASAEPANYTFTTVDNNERYQYWIGALVNVDTTNPLDVSSGVTQLVDDQTPAVPSVTTTAAGGLVLSSWFVDNDAAVDYPTSPDFVTHTEYVPNADNNNFNVVSQRLAVAGATDPLEAVGVNGGRDPHVITFAMRAATGATASGTATAAAITKTPIGATGDTFETITLTGEASGAENVVAGGTLALTRPATQDGDVLIAIIGKEDDPEITPPAGWTAISTLADTTQNDIFTGAWYRIVTNAASEPAAYDFISNGVNTQEHSYWIGSYDNVDTDVVVDAPAAWVKRVDDSTPAAPSVTTVSGGAEIIAAWFVLPELSVDVPSLPWQIRVRNLQVGTTQRNLTVLNRQQAVVGSTGDVEISSIGGGDETHTIQIALRPERISVANAIRNMNLYQDHVVVRHEDSDPLTISDMNLFDNTDDSDVPFVIGTSPDSLTVLAGNGLAVFDGKTFTPGGPVTLSGAGSTIADGSFRIGQSATYLSTTTDGLAVGGSFYVDAGGVYSGASSTVTFGASNPVSISAVGSSTIAIHDVIFAGSGMYALQTPLIVDTDVAVNSGTLTGVSDLTVENGDLSGAGVVDMIDGTVTLGSDNTFGSATPWSFYNLTFGSGAVAGVTTPATGSVVTTINNQLRIASGHFLDAGSTSWNLTGSGTVFDEQGTFLEDTATIRYSGVTPNVTQTAYYDLQIDAGVGSTTLATAPATGLQVLGDLQIGQTGSSTLRLDTNNPTLGVNQDLVIGTNGTLVASAVTPINVFGGWTNDGQFIANGGLVELLNATGTVAINAGDSAFYDLDIAGAGDFVFSESATSTNDTRLLSGSVTVNSAEQLAVGGEFRNQLDNALTTWTGSTLHLFGGGAYVVNDKLDADDYATVRVSSSTQPRFWNSDYAAITTEPGSSLYSMDHDQVIGDLHIYGDLRSDSFNDHWSYARDWDGASLATERIANVLVENGGSVLYTGGALTAAGTSTASTTIGVLGGTGTFDLTLGGTTTVDLHHYVVRDVTSDGLVLAGTPTIIELSHGDFVSPTIGASGITVGASVINANQARNFTGNGFSNASGGAAVNVKATGTPVSSWRFVNAFGNLVGEAFDADPDAGGDPGSIVWEDSAAIIDVTGRVYEADRTTVSNVCNGSTPNIRLSIQGLTFASTTCNATTGEYTFPGIGFGPSDTLTVYINDAGTEAATVTKDPISLIGNLDLYESHVIVRHESSDPMTIEAMSVYDSSNDSDIPFTATTGAVDTLTLAADTGLIIWNDKIFAPGGDVILPGGSIATHSGSLELFAGATFDGGTHAYSIGGSLLSDSAATFDAETSTTTFTSSATGRTIDTNDSGFHSLVLDGLGSWTIIDSEGDINQDLIINRGTLTLPAATTTVSGSFVNTGGSFNANAGALVLDSIEANQHIQFGGSAANRVEFTGSGSWAFLDTNSTTTDDIIISSGLVTLPSGTLEVAGNFIASSTIAHNGGTLLLTDTAGGNELTLGGDDAGTVQISAAGGDYTLTDSDATLLGSLTLTNGVFTSGSGTLAVGQSFDVSGGTFNNNGGTILLNGATSGLFIDTGNDNDFNNLVVAGSGAWTLVGSATTTNNFSLQTAGGFTVAPDSSVYVGGVFSNTVGGAATTWTDTTLVLDGANRYEVGVKTTATETYGTLQIGANSNISFWNSSAATTSVPLSSSLYSQDHAGSDGALNIYGSYTIATTTEHWSAATDFDGANISDRPVTVRIASSSSVILDGGVLNILGVTGATTTITNQGTGQYALIAQAGTLNAEFYDITNIDSDGLQLLLGVGVTSLSNGSFTQTSDGASLITLTPITINSNPNLVVTDTAFNAGGFSGGVNVNLSATTTNSWNFTGAIGDLWGEAFDIDGTDLCSSVRWDDSECLLIEQSNYRWRNDDGGEGAPTGTWYDDDWGQRQRIRVVNNNPTAVATTAVKLPVIYDADMQTDFDDVRVTLADGVSITPHWIERFQSGVDATVWFQAPALNDDVTEFYLYYGNLAANSSSDADQVFDTVEDFESSGLTPYDGDISLFNIGNSFAFGGALGLDTDGNEQQRATDGIARDGVTVSAGQTIRYMQYIDTSAGANDEVCTLFAVQSQMQDNNNYGLCVQQPGVDRISLVRDVVDTEASGTILESSSAIFTTGWYEFVIDWRVDGAMQVAMYDINGTLIADLSAIDTTYSSGGIGFTYWFQHGGWDSYVAYPRIGALPTVYLGDEQLDGGATWAGDQNTPTGGFSFGSVARLRVGIENTGLPIENQNFEIEFAPKLTAATCEAVPATNYAPVPTVASCGTSAICMANSTEVSNGDATSDHLVTDAGDFSAGEIVSNTGNRSNNLNLGQNRYTELEYALTLTTSAANDAYCFRVTDSGDELDAYNNLPELTLAFDPVISEVSLNDGLDIQLTAGTTTLITASTTVTDFNGVADLASATTTFYKTTANSNCTPNDNDCYIATSTCSFTACTGNSCSLQCTIPMVYHADPTDFDAGEEWFAFIEVSDQSGAADLRSSMGVELLTLRALDVQNAIAYGTVDVAQDTGTNNPNVDLINVGNENIDVQVAGTDMSDGIASVIPAGQQRFATSSFNYAACLGCATLSVLGTNVEVDLPKPVATDPPTTDQIFWGIEVPFGTASNPHTGVNTFTAVPD
jgi:hypothetical protein